MNFKAILQENKFCDCIIEYSCNDAISKKAAHMIILATCPYFENLFKWTESKPVLEGKRYVNLYQIKIDFPEKTILSCIDLLYDKNLTLKDQSVEDLFNCLVFFNLSREHIIKVIKAIVNEIYDNNCHYNKEEIILSICNSNVEIDLKQNFLARSFHLLSILSQEKLTVVLPKHVFNNKSTINGDIIKICADETDGKFEHRELVFETYTTINQDDESNDIGFWLTCNPKCKDGDVNVLKGKVTLTIYDGISVINKRICKGIFERDNDGDRNLLTFPTPFDKSFYSNNRSRYGTIIADTYRSYIAYEFNIEIIYSAI